MKVIRLIVLRVENGQTQEQAAKMFGVSTQHYCQIENGRVKAGREFIEKFKKVYPDETADIFFEGVN